MDAAFYENYNHLAQIPFNATEKAMIIAMFSFAIIGLFLNGLIFVALIRNSSTEFRRANYVLMIGQIFGNLMMVVGVAFRFRIVLGGVWSLGYTKCIISFTFGSGSASVALLCLNFMVVEQTLTVIFRRAQWTSFYIFAAYAFVFVDFSLFMTGLFWNPDLISYPILSDSRLYCFPDMTDQRPLTRIAGFIVVICIFSSPFFVTAGNLFLWWMVSDAENSYRTTIANSNSNILMNTSSSLSKKKMVVIKRGIVTSVANILGFALFLYNVFCKWYSSTSIGAVLDGVSIFLVVLYLCIISPTLIIAFDVKIRKDILAILHLKNPSIDTMKLTKGVTVQRKRAHNAWSLSKFSTFTTTNTDVHGA